MTLSARLTLTRVVFEYTEDNNFKLEIRRLTLTRVVFELRNILQAISFTSSD